MSSIPLSLIQDVKHNVPGAFEQLVKLMEPRLNNMVQYGCRFLRVTSCGGDVQDDIRQEALLALWQATKSFDPERSQDFAGFAQWFIWGRLRRYLERTGRLYLREWPHDTLFFPHQLSQMSAEYFDKIHDEVMASLSLLPLEQQQAVVTYIATGSFKAAAQILGVSKVTVRKRLMHALVGLQLHPTHKHNKGEADKNVQS